MTLTKKKTHNLDKALRKSKQYIAKESTIRSTTKVRRYRLLKDLNVLASNIKIKKIIISHSRTTKI